MKIISPEDLESDSSLLSNSIFIYPTDTIYGIGCDARNEKAIAVIRILKQRPTQPFSVIAPSIEWIREHCDVPDQAKQWLEKLPGPYTLILKIKKKSCARNLSFSDSLGVRIPNHWIARVVHNCGSPIVTTSVNTHGNPPMASLQDLEPKFEKAVAYAIDEGEVHGSPSTIADFRDGVKITTRKMTTHRTRSL